MAAVEAAPRSSAPPSLLPADQGGRTLTSGGLCERSCLPRPEEGDAAVAGPADSGASDQIRLFGPEMLPDPYPTYQRLRAEDPVHWYEAFGAWVLTRYDDVDAVLRDLRFSSTLGDVVPAGTAADEQGWQALRGLYTFV